MSFPAPSPVNRRQFLRASAGGVASALFAPGLLAGNEEPELRLALIHGEGDATANGMALGIREARHAGALLNRNLTCLRIGATSDEIGRARREGAHSVILGVPTGDAAAIAATCERNGLLILNAKVADDTLRRRHCGPLVFHVAASEAMLADARAASPQAGLTAPVAMWHPSLVRFGAAQLNDRFAEHWKSPMTSAAWAGWIAVKIAWEAFLRASAPSASAIGEYLARDATHFDGHKGVPLSFRSWDHQLRQPLYVILPGAPVIEVPQSASEGSSIRQVLDAIGDKPGSSNCSR